MARTNARIGFITWAPGPEGLVAHFHPLGESGQLDAGFVLVARIRAGAVPNEELLRIAGAQEDGSSTGGLAVEQHGGFLVPLANRPDQRAWEAHFNSDAVLEEYAKRRAHTLQKSEYRTEPTTVDAEYYETPEPEPTPRPPRAQPTVVRA